MITNNHSIYFQNSQSLSSIGNSSVNLIVTSPPYSMVAMWDDNDYGLNARQITHQSPYII